MPKKEFFEIGKIVNTHGIRGEVKIEPWADSPEQLAAVKTLWLDGIAKKAASRVHGNFVICKLQDVDSVESAMTLKNKTVFAHRADIPIEEGACFVQDLTGLNVFNEDGIQIGILKDILEYPAGNVFLVQGQEEHLIPENGGFIKELNLQNGTITVHLIEGM